MSVPPRKAFADLLEMSLPQEPGYRAPSAVRAMDYIEFDNAELEKLRALGEIEDKKNAKRTSDWWRDRQTRIVDGIVADVATILKRGPCTAQDIHYKMVASGKVVMVNTCREAARALVERGVVRSVVARSRRGRSETFSWVYG